MQFRRSQSMRPLDEDWHRGRQSARERAFDGDLSVFSDTEEVKYDLDTAQIDGSDNPRTWMWSRVYDIFGMNGTDVRTLEDR